MANEEKDPRQIGWKLPVDVIKRFKKWCIDVERGESEAITEILTEYLDRVEEKEHAA